MFGFFCNFLILFVLLFNYLPVVYYCVFIFFCLASYSQIVKAIYTLKILINKYAYFEEQYSNISIYF